MNQRQREYALGRIESIRAAKCAAVISDNTTPAVKLTDLEKWELIKSGKVVIKPFEDLSSYCPYLYNSYNFRAFEAEAIKDSAKIKVEVEVIEKKARKLKDCIMLADAETALQMIQQFEEE